jgi:hypothetical protein
MRRLINYFGGDKIEEEMGGACSSYGGKGVYRVLVGRPGRKRLLGRPRRRWEDNIKMDLQEVECGVWTVLSWLKIDRLRALVNVNESSGSIKCREFLEQLQTG